MTSLMFGYPSVLEFVDCVEAPSEAKPESGCLFWSTISCFAHCFATIVVQITMRPAEARNVVLYPGPQIDTALARPKGIDPFPFADNILVPISRPDGTSTFLALVLLASLSDLGIVKCRWLIVAETVVAHGAFNPRFPKIGPRRENRTRCSAPKHHHWRHAGPEMWLALVGRAVALLQHGDGKSRRCIG